MSKHINDWHYSMFILCMLLILIYIISVNIEYFITQINSTINGKSYGVQDEYDNKLATANLLAQLHTTIDTLIRNLHTEYKNSDERVNRLIHKFKNTIIEEAPNEIDSSSYTINKGELMALCLRPKNIKKTTNSPYHDYNTLLFVTIHELTHIMSLQEGHGHEFISNFKFILQHAHKYGLYQPVNYNTNPINYCGVAVTNNPYYN